MLVLLVPPEWREELGRRTVPNRRENLVQEPRFVQNSPLYMQFRLLLVEQF
jgi:hypothetical protein